MIVVSVICHGHERLIPELDCLSKLARDDNIKVVLKNNCQLNDSHLSEYCDENGVFFVDEHYGKGFGENNNYVFDYALKNLGLTDDDYFIVLNPDVNIELSELNLLIEKMKKNATKLAAINLYKDIEFKAYDKSIRNYPRFKDFVHSLLLGRNKTLIDKSKINDIIKVDWAAGSFLAFNVQHYKALKGFDEGYFMYCEDLDICWRSNRECGEKVQYYPTIKALHLAHHGSRSIFSKHFFWHLKSVFRYIYKTRSWHVK